MQWTGRRDQAFTANRQKFAAGGLYSLYLRHRPAIFPNDSLGRKAENRRKNAEKRPIVTYLT